MLGLLDSLTAAFSISVAVRDPDGTLLLFSGWSDICFNFHRTDSLVAQKCTENNQYSLSDFQDNSNPILHRCHMGMTSSVTPIVVSGEYVGNIIFSQFFTDKPDIEYFRRQAKVYGFNEEAYLNSVVAVPRLTVEQVENIQNVIRKLVELFAELGQKRLLGKKIEQDLRQSENKFNQLFESMPLPIYIIDKNFAIVIYNKAMSEILGASSQQEFVWQKVDAISPEYQPDGQLSCLKSEELIEQAFRHGNMNFEWTFRKFDGSNFIANVNNSIITINGHEFLLAQCRNITGQKLEEEAKDRYLSLLVATLNTTLDGILVADDSGEIEIYNNRFVQMLNCPSEMLKTLNWEKLLDYAGQQLKNPDDLFQHISALKEDREKEDTGSLEFKDGRFFEFYTRPQVMGGHPVGRLWCYHDKTKRRRAESELEEYRSHLEKLVEQRTIELEETNKKLQEEILNKNEIEQLLRQSLNKEKQLNEFKSQFISTASHEFRTPLTLILASADLLEMQMDRFPDKSLMRYIKKIQDSVENMTGLIDEVLSLSRADRGKIRFEPKKIDLYNLCQEILNDFRQYSGEIHNLLLEYDAAQQ